MLPPDFNMLTPEQQESYLVKMLMEKYREIDLIMKWLGEVRKKLKG